jgi:hypothetical protein
MALFKNVTVTFNVHPVLDAREAEIEYSGERITHSADLDVFLTWQGLVKKDRQITVMTDDVSDAFGNDAQGTSGALSLVAKTADGGSDKTFSGTFMLISISGRAIHADVNAGCRMVFAAVSSDGSTDPVSFG